MIEFKKGDIVILVDLDKYYGPLKLELNKEYEVLDTWLDMVILKGNESVYVKSTRFILKPTPMTNPRFVTGAVVRPLPGYYPLSKPSPDGYVIVGIPENTGEITIETMQGQAVGTYAAQSFVVHPFKKGDKVEIGRGNPPRTVTKAYFALGTPYVHISYYGDSQFSAGNFTLYTPMATQFKKGDKVRCTTGRFDYIGLHEELVIDKLIQEIGYQTLYFKYKKHSYTGADFELVPTGKLAGYKLLKDLPDIKSGAVFQKARPGMQYPWEILHANDIEYAYPQETFDSKPDWFEPVYEPEHERYTTTNGKVLEVNKTAKNISLVGGNPQLDGITFADAKKLLKLTDLPKLNNAHDLNFFKLEIQLGCVHVSYDDLLNIGKLMQ